MPGSDLEPGDGEVQEQPDGGTRVVAASYSGPLPPPEWMDGYERIMPGSGAQIMAMAMREQGHRRKMESRALWLGYGDNALAKVLTGGAIAAIAYLVINGHDVIPGILAALIAVGPVSKLVRWILKLVGGGNGG